MEEEKKKTILITVSEIGNTVEVTGMADASELMLTLNNVLASIQKEVISSSRILMPGSGRIN